MHTIPTRRSFLHTAAGATAGLIAAPWLLAQPAARRPKVAAIFTVFTYRSHAHVILENFLGPYLFNGRKTDPGVDIASFYCAQFPGSDMSRGVAKEYDIPMYDSIDKALCLGGDRLAVDAVLLIGEHGDYPTNELAQKQYPRKEFFDQSVAVMKRSNRFVPLFNDKHLSYRWDWAKQMYDTTVELGIPFMAGSSVPLAQRVPPLELPADAVIEEAVSIHGGGVESYDIHALEVLQSIVESRKGGETGVKSVQFLAGKALMDAAAAGEWSTDLARAAMAVEYHGAQEVGDDFRVQNVEPHGILIRYQDGTRGTMLRLGGSGIRWNFACRLKGESKIRATSYYVGPWNNRNLFKALSHAIQHLFVHRRQPYAVERTLLTTGMLDAAMHSRVQDGKVLETPQLGFAYEPIDYRAMREMGASWKIITEQTEQPRGVMKWGDV